MKIRQSDPRGEYLKYKAEIDAAILRALESGSYILGAEVESFEAEFARFVGREDAVGVASGTDALTLAIRLAVEAPGDLVATTSHTASATVAAIEAADATPVLIDVDEETYCMSPSKLQETIISDRQTIKAVVPVHLYGHPADMTPIMEIAQSNQLAIVEDCAQAHGATSMGRQVGSFGDLGIFSFYPTKNLGALGDGGAIVSDSNDAVQLRAMRQYGWKDRFVSEFHGVNSRLDEIQAAVLRVKLKHLESLNDSRRSVASVYLQGLRDTPLKLPVERPESRHVYHQFVVRTPRREALMRFLAEKGVATGIHYPKPVHQQPAYQTLRTGAGGLNVTEAICREIVSLPMHPGLSEADAITVVETIREFFTL